MHFLSNFIIALGTAAAIYMGYLFLYEPAPEMYDTTIVLEQETKAIPQTDGSTIIGLVEVPALELPGGVTKPMLDARQYNAFIEYQISPNGRYVYLATSPTGNERLRIYVYDVKKQERYLAKPQVDGSWGLNNNWLSVRWNDLNQLELEYDNQYRNRMGQIIGLQKMKSVDGETPWELIYYE